MYPLWHAVKSEQRQNGSEGQRAKESAFILMFSAGSPVPWSSEASNLVVSDEARFLSAHSKVNRESECWLALLSL